MFEHLFKSADSTKVTFEYLKSFKRARVTFETACSATEARLRLHGFNFFDSKLCCYLAQVLFVVN